MTFSRLSTGRHGESLAVDYLKERGYRIVEKNFRCRHGEIDIIAMESGAIAFVEVRTKTSGRFGPPILSVDLKKQRQISKAALMYLMQKKLTNHPARFDVVGINIHDDRTEIELVRNAFELRL